MEIGFYFPVWDIWLYSYLVESETQARKQPCSCIHPWGAGDTHSHEHCLSRGAEGGNTKDSGKQHPCNGPDQQGREEELKLIPTLLLESWQYHHMRDGAQEENGIEDKRAAPVTPMWWHQVGCRHMKVDLKKGIRTCESVDLEVTERTRKPEFEFLKDYHSLYSFVFWSVLSIFIRQLFLKTDFLLLLCSTEAVAWLLLGLTSLEPGTELHV